MKDTLWKPVPRSVRKALEERGIAIGEVCSLAAADMNNDGGLQNIYLLLTPERLIFAVSDQCGEMAYAGSALPKRRQPEGIAELYDYPFSRLGNPKILNQVVGGLLTVDVDGTETWLCRFSGTKMRRMQRFCEDLDALLSGRPLKERGDDGEDYCPKCGAPYPERGRAVCPRCMEKHTVFVRILQYFKNYKLRVVVMLSGVTISGLANAVWPYLSGSVLYDQVLGGGGELAEKLGIPGNAMLLLLLLVLTMAGTHFIRHLTGIIHGRMTAYMVPDIVCKLKQRVFDSLKDLSVGFFTRRQTGSLMQRVNGDANEVMGFFIDGLPYFLFNVVTMALSIFVMFSMNWKLALVAIVMLPPAAIVCYVVGPRYWHANGRRARMVRSMYSLLNDDIVGARVVRAFGQEKNENKRFDKVNERVRAAEMRVVHYGNQYDIAYSLTRDIPNLLVWSVGALILLNSPGNFTYGELLTFVSYLTMLQGPLEFFSDVFRWWASSMNSAQRVFEIIDSHPEIEEKENPLQLDIQGDVELRGVSFSYEPNKPVLKDISFHIHEGEMLGIVGKSGAGKSTLVNLISRLYDPDDGEVLLDGNNVKDISFASLRGAVAMVSQETYIFMGTVAENIAYARPDASREEIVRAAIAASAHGFICRLPDGYDTVIGSGGRELSGGERQRVSIARAILADPKILVLDEATASVDTETERAIQASLEKLIQGRTTISIAHRLSTLRNADRLIVLDNGRLVESGTHEELVQQRGVYYKLLQLQSKALAMRGIE
ncbi:MAG TPA: ATP-binding cassette domain-containing protein [Firmicutes bacterium]|nr:ATP-binding cassette domain-containing protein [Bacillota bacterium]